ncbi:MAG TPA: hypothetical protein VHN80_26840, partial [Kineosporiaceae bacterium]|nr:hypothetical protein [Kineosporiaceae bacterium]
TIGHPATLSGHVRNCRDLTDGRLQRSPRRVPAATIPAVRPRGTYVLYRRAGASRRPLRPAVAAYLARLERLLGSRESDVGPGRFEY